MMSSTLFAPSERGLSRQDTLRANELSPPLSAPKGGLSRQDTLRANELSPPLSAPKGGLSRQDTLPADSEQSWLTTYRNLPSANPIPPRNEPVLHIQVPQIDENSSLKHLSFPKDPLEDTSANALALEITIKVSHIL
jgi:hypothetical protein